MSCVLVLCTIKHIQCKARAHSYSTYLIIGNYAVLLMCNCYKFYVFEDFDYCIYFNSFSNGMLHKYVYVVFTCRSACIFMNPIYSEGNLRSIFVIIIEIKWKSNDQHRPLTLLRQNKLFVKTSPSFFTGSLLYKNFDVRFGVDRFKLRSHVI